LRYAPGQPQASNNLAEFLNTLPKKQKFFFPEALDNKHESMYGSSDEKILSR